MLTTVPYFFIFLMFAIVSSCSNNSNQSNGNLSTDVVNNPKSAAGMGDTTQLPKMQFETEIHDFGTITEGEKVEYNFKFKNSGSTDLIISSAKGSCGCTIPVWTKEPIPPGGESIIKVSFNSEGKHGIVDKKVTIIANTNPNTKVLKITGKITESGNGNSSE